MSSSIFPSRIILRSCNREGRTKALELFAWVVFFHFSIQDHSSQLQQLFFFRKLRSLSHDVPKVHLTVYDCHVQWRFVAMGNHRSLGVTPMLEENLHMLLQILFDSKMEQISIHPISTSR